MEMAQPAPRKRENEAGAQTEEATGEPPAKLLVRNSSGASEAPAKGLVRNFSNPPPSPAFPPCSPAPDDFDDLMKLVAAHECPTDKSFRPPVDKGIKYIVVS